MTYISLFISAFLAATLLPLSSEILLGALVLAGKSNVVGLWFWATLGNVAGSSINWSLGRYFLHFIEKKDFLFTQQEMHKAQARFSRYGVWSLLLAWVPIIGDPLTFIAGALRVPIGLFLLLVSLGKGTRYFLVIYLMT
jgi:membrane protein YqaA with SNARE-associated domain